MDHNAAPADNANDGKVAVFDPNTEQFSVYPKTDCPHLAAHLNSDANPELIEEAFLKHNSCNSCQNPSENWICLTCHGVFCSRYVNKHAAEHSEKEKHSVAMSFSDLSIWCYECEWYITHPSLRLKTASLYKAKFNEEHPSITKMRRKAEKAKAKAEKQAAAATGAVPPPNPVYQHGGDLESLEVSAANAELEAANAQQP